MPAMPDPTASANSTPGAGAPARPGYGGGSRSAATKKTQPMAEFKMTASKPLTYQLSLAPQLAMFFNAKITLALGPRHLILASEPALATEAVALEEKESAGWKPSGEFDAAVADLPKNLVALAVTDPRDSTPKALAELPSTLSKALTVVANRGMPLGGTGSATVSVTGGPPPGFGPGGQSGGPPSGPPGVQMRGAQMGMRVQGIRPPGAGGGDESPGFGPGRGLQGVAPPGAGGAGGGGLQGVSPPGTSGAGAGAPGSQGFTPPFSSGGGPPGSAPGGGIGPGASAAPPTGMVAFSLSISPDKIPSAESIKPHLFPGAMAVSVDQNGIRIVSRDAFFDVAGSAAIFNAMSFSALTPAAMSGGPMPGGFPGQSGPGGFPNAPGAGVAPPGGSSGGGVPASRPD
jgi:hypothetical protein